MPPDDAGLDDETIVARHKSYNPAAEDVPLTPQADVGVLLVHGIGNHREGVTLRAFGQPMLDWLKEWLRGKGGEHARGDVVVSEARFNDPEAPAYALVQVAGTDREAPEKKQKESWLFCEGWWGSTVQSPASLQLLRWMWTRGPLLIYWHFYIRQTAGKEKKSKTTQTDFFFGLLALLLAGFCQVVIGIAMLLSLIPIGPWRQKVVAAVRVLTLTLGDSYVLEEDIQRAALAERVRRALEWLMKRSQRTVVIAHSQGGAIAHEVLRQSEPASVSMFISVGSGLEKLHFLHEAMISRQGLLMAGLIFPCAALGGGVVLSTTEHWGIGLGVVLLIVALSFCVSLVTLFESYKRQLSTAVPALALPGLGQDKWIDIYASDDVVPMSRGSLLDKAHFLVRRKVYNERSYVRDHVSYFTNVNDCLPGLWQSLAELSGVRLFMPGDDERLGRFAWVHKAHAHIISFSRLSLFIAVFLSAWVLRHSLLGFGKSVLESAEGTFVGDWLKPVRGFAGMVASLVKRLWKTDALTADVLANALFGAVVLLGAIALWWIIFRAFWLSRCAACWRKACRDGDVLQTRPARIRFLLACALFLCFGCLPLIVSIILAASPDYLTVATLGNAIAVTLGVFALILALFFTAATPWGLEALWQDQNQPLLTRIVSPASMALIIWGLWSVAQWLWPYELKPSLELTALVAFFVLLGLACQVFGVLKFRTTCPIGMAATIVVPILGAVILWLRLPHSYMPAALYSGLAVAVLLSIVCLRRFKILGA